MLYNIYDLIFVFLTHFLDKLAKVFPRLFSVLLVEVRETKNGLKNKLKHSNMDARSIQLFSE